MEITFDKEADAMYIKFKKGNFAKNKKVDDLTILDLDEKGNVLGVELLGVSNRITKGSSSYLSLKKLLAEV